MAERPPLAPPFSYSSPFPSPNRGQDPPPSTSLARPIFETGTYVVQVPKDQIYRVPPPENALFVERHQNPEQKKRRHSCSSFSCCFIIVAVVTIAIGLAVGLSFSFLEPKNPEFQVKRFFVKNSSSKGKHDYDITLKVYNPNAKSDILYNQGGVASLLFKDKKLGVAKFPTFHQDDQNTTDIRLVLKGYDNMKSAKLKANNVQFSLKIGVPVKMKTSSFRTGDTKLAVTCDFTVDKLAKASTRLLSQQCETNR